MSNIEICKDATSDANFNNTIKVKTMPNNIARGSAGQFFVAAELCRRDLVAVVTMGNTPNTDILCSNVEGTKFVHIQVKTFDPQKRKVTVGEKAEKAYGDNFFWVLAGVPKNNTDDEHEYYIIPSSVVAKNVKEGHDKWLNTLGKGGKVHNPTSMRIIDLPPKTSSAGWSVEQYKNRWDIIEGTLDSNFNSYSEYLQYHADRKESKRLVELEAETRKEARQVKLKHRDKKDI